MKMNKEQFLKTEFGGELESTITAWDDALSRNREDGKHLLPTEIIPEKLKSEQSKPAEAGHAGIASCI